MVRSRSRRAALCVATILVLVLSGCGSDTASGDVDADAATADADAPSPAGSSVAPESSDRDYVEPDYDGLPTDLTPDEVCALLDEPTIVEHLEAPVTGMTPGSRQPDCTWTYKLYAGPSTTLQVQVMSMDQTSERLGVEALEWALDRAPSDVEITEVSSLEVPNASYEFGASTVIFTIDPEGRIFTLAAHSDSPEAGRIALVKEVLAALAARS